MRLAAAGVLALGLVLVACGKSNAPSGGGGGGGNGGGSAATVQAQNVDGVGMVLVDSRGFTLYRLEGETTSKVKCTGDCVSAWPPLQASDGLEAGSGVTGKLATFKRPDGTTQVTYDGIPLYTYSGDTGPGQANGQGVQGVWFAVTPQGTDAKGSAGGASSSGGGYHY